MESKLKTQQTIPGEKMDYWKMRIFNFCYKNMLSLLLVAITLLSGLIYKVVFYNNLYSENQKHAVLLTEYMIKRDKNILVKILNNSTVYSPYNQLAQELLFIIDDQSDNNSTDQSENQSQHNSGDKSAASMTPKTNTQMPDSTNKTTNLFTSTIFARIMDILRHGNQPAQMSALEAELYYIKTGKIVEIDTSTSNEQNSGMDSNMITAKATKHHTAQNNKTLRMKLALVGQEKSIDSLT